MTRETAVNKLMQEWRASEEYRPFFTRMVDEWMGEAKNVLTSDLNGIREKINNFR